MIIIIPLFTLGSIYSTNASGAKQMPETELNRIKNPNWSEVNQLAIYKHGRGLELRLLWTNPATVVVRAALELGVSQLNVSNHMASCLLQWDAAEL